MTTQPDNDKDLQAFIAKKVQEVEKRGGLLVMALPNGHVRLSAGKAPPEKK